MSNPSSRPRPVPDGTSPGSPLRPSSPDPSVARSASNARLASPIPSANSRRRGDSISQYQRENGSGRNTGAQTPLAGGSPDARGSGQPGTSALANALNASLGRSPTRMSAAAPDTSQLPRSGSFVVPTTNYGSFSRASVRSRKASGTQSPAPYEDFDVVRRHLAGPSGVNAVDRSPSRNLSPHRGHEQTPGFEAGETTTAPNLDENFSSLRLQGGDIHRAIYRRSEAEANQKTGLRQRSQSFEVRRPDPVEQELNIESIREPGGFRRNHIIRNVPNHPIGDQLDGSAGSLTPVRPQPNFVSRNFYEFLSLYGHFAGEDVDEDDDDSESSQTPWENQHGQDEDEYGGSERALPDERRPLLSRRQSKRERKRESAPKKGAAGTIFILLKSFVGTGVLFLPRAFLNGGILFASLILLLIACVSYYCFLLLTTSRLVLKGSYAEMGEMVQGKWLRLLINASLVLSQMGFASAYIVFTSENLRAFVLAVSHDNTAIDIKLMILMQLIIFLPLSLYRNLNNISYVVYIADIFIVLGLVYLYYFGIATIAAQHGAPDVMLFNSSTWTLFIGTAIFTFEGIGLVIPIQDGMKRPQQLPSVLGLVMVIISTIYISMGAISYAAYGSKTQTVIILNMPQDNKFVNGVQFLYSLAILLSTPMQLYPAITIMEKGIFTKSGKHSRNIKWRKNGFRFGVVMLSAAIAWIGANDLDKFVALVGSFACIPLVYIYPPIIHSKAVATTRWSKSVDAALVILGFILMVYTTALTIMSWVR